MELFKFKTKIILTQLNAAGGGLSLRYFIPIGETMKVDSLEIGKDNYAVGGRAVAFNIWDTLNLYSYIMQHATIDDEVISLRKTKHDGSVVEDTIHVRGAVLLPFTMLTGMRFIVSAYNIIQNETLTLTILGRCTLLPEFTTAGSGGTPSLSTIYNKTV